MKITLSLYVLIVLSCSVVQAQVIDLSPGETRNLVIKKGERQVLPVLMEAGQYVHISVDLSSWLLLFQFQDPTGQDLEENWVRWRGGEGEIILQPKQSGLYQLYVSRYEIECEPSESSCYEEPEEASYRIFFKEFLSPAEYQKRLDRARDRHQETIQWLRDHAIPLQGVEAESGFDDLQPLKEIIGDAHLVSLGEATHGTREFFKLKHRMLEFLVSEMGFTVFAIEATMPETFDVNEYVLNGKGDPEKALAGLYMWTWNTEEVLEMIRWMRRYNADPDHTRKVKFYGFDMQSGSRALKVLTSFLDQADPRVSEEFRDLAVMARIANPYTERDLAESPSQEVEEALEALDSIINRMDLEREEYVSRTGENEWAIARLHANILTQNVRRWTMSNARSVRDSSMAANVKWIVNHEGPDAKVVLWAHNIHVATSAPRFVPMGQHLREEYGKDMIVFGFSFNEGSFQAYELPFGAGKSLRPFHVSPLPEESLDATLGATGLSIAAIDLRLLPDSGSVAQWFSKPHQSRQIGSGTTGSGFAPEVQVTELYDAMFFVEQTTASRPNAGGKGSRERTLVVPENLGFESSDSGTIPAEWNVRKYWLANFDFTAVTDTRDSYQGEKSLKISRSPGRHYGEAFGSVSQRLDATPYRGKLIRFKGAVRTDVEGPGNQAYLWFRTTRQGTGSQDDMFSDTMSDRPITVSEWQFFVIEGTVPEEAMWIRYGMALTGEGSAWFDALSLEVINPD